MTPRSDWRNISVAGEGGPGTAAAQPPLSCAELKKSNEPLGVIRCLVRMGVTANSIGHH